MKKSYSWKKFAWVLLLLCLSVLSAFPQVSKLSVAYRENAEDEYSKQMCVLDIYLPENISKPAPVLVWFHGGGLTGGHREVPSKLKNNGFIIVGVEYRLSPNVKTASCIDDAAAATAWVMKHCSSFGGNPEQIVIAGHSAGGYLVSMIALDKSWLAKYGVDADKLAAVIPYSGQMITHFENRRERGRGALEPEVDRFAPLYHMRKDAPPFLIMTGDRELELYGRYEENAYFVRMLKLIGHKGHEFYELQGFDHGSMVEPAHFITIKYLKNMMKK